MSKTASNQSRLRRVPISDYQGGERPPAQPPESAPSIYETHEGSRLRRVPIGGAGAASSASAANTAIQGRPVSSGKSGARTTAAQRQARRAAQRKPGGTSRGLLLGGILGIIVAGILLATLAYYFAKNNQPSNQQGVIGQQPGAVSTQPGAVSGASDADTGNAPSDKGGAAGQSSKPSPDLGKEPLGLFDTTPPGVNRGQFNLPRGITQDAEGNFYVSDTDNERIQKFDPTGKWLAMFGNLGTGDGQFNPMDVTASGTGPGGLAVDKEGNVYVADTWNHRIQKFNKDGKFIAKWGSFISITDAAAANDPDANTKFWGPRGVAIGPEGDIYVTDTGNKRVLIFDPNGKFVRKIDSGLTQARLDAKDEFNKPGELNEPIGIAVDGQGNIFVADTKNNRIQKFDKDLKPAAQWPVPSGAWAPAPYLEPFLALDGEGNVYATAPSTKAVLKFGPDGKEAGQKNKEGDAILLRPTGITVGSDGTVYVVDTESSHVVNFGKIP